MKKLLSAFVFAAALGTGSALAADMKVKAPPPRKIPGTLRSAAPS